MNFLPPFYIEHLKSQLKRAEFLILLMLVVILQQHRMVKLEELASQFPQKILFESRRKKLQRFLSLPHLTLEIIWWPLFTSWLNNNFGSNEVLYIAIDRTQWGLVNLIVVSLIYDKRAIPIYFEVLPKLGNTNVDKQIGVLSKVLPLFSNYTVVILGDREFCSVDLAQWLTSQPQTGLHGIAWVESLAFMAEQTIKLMSLSPHKKPYYQRGRCAQKLIQSTFRQ